MQSPEGHTRYRRESVARVSAEVEEIAVLRHGEVVLRTSKTPSSARVRLDSRTLPRATKGVPVPVRGRLKGSVYTACRRSWSSCSRL
jgi:hypothetical protein